MHMLRMGSRGSDVGDLQNALKRFEPSLVSDRVFGPHTERAVRLAQRRLGLFPPDGISGPKTMAALTTERPAPRKTVAATNSGGNASGSWASTAGALVDRAGVALKTAETGIATWLSGVLTGPASVPKTIRKPVVPAMKRAEHSSMPADLATPVTGMRMSLKGRQFIIRHEGQRGVSNHLHHPTMGSGVTIGPGYDMKKRSAAEVAGHLRLVGVDPATAAKAAEGAGLWGPEARKFVKDNKQLLDLSETAQAALLTHIIGQYESKARRAIKIPLYQHEFDALVSYAYNPGGGWVKTTKLVNARKPAQAVIELSKHIYSHHQRVHSLVVRREAETRMFLYGEYR